MSATSDKTQKSTFVFTSLYEVYKKNQAAADAIKGLRSGAVIKARDLKEEDLKKPELPISRQVDSFSPPELIGKRFAKPAVMTLAKMPQHAPKNEAIESLRDNLKKLNDLHARLRFMLQELETLVKE